jgi:hypothetical protein
MHKLTISIAAAALFSFGSLNAATLDFAINAPTPGSISFSGTAGDGLVGVDIEVDTLVGLDTPSESETLLQCHNCLLNFTTGGFTNRIDNVWNFSHGGFLSLTGDLDFDGDNTMDIIGATLVSGTFLNASNVHFESSNFIFNVASGSFTDQKHAEILSFYGLPAVDYLGGMSISFTSGSITDNAFMSDSIYSGSIVNTAVPVPAAIWLFGSALLGLLGYSHRR